MNPLTAQAVSHQLAGLKAESYELGIRTPKAMIKRQLDGAGVMKSLPWFGYMNANGSDIYIRPSKPLGFVLLDDLTQEGLKALERDGYRPAVILETSVANYQAWIRLVDRDAQRPLTCEVLTAAAKLLATRYHADPAAADWRHLGRLAGFTNRKPKRRAQGRAPFVLLRAAPGVVAPRGGALLEELGDSMLDPLPKPSNTARADPRAHGYDDCLTELLGGDRTVRTANPDWSRLDFGVACLLVRKGWQKEQIIQILSGSPNLATRKVGHVQDYLERTVQKAMRQ